MRASDQLGLFPAAPREPKRPRHDIGMAVSPDGSTLIVAESHAHRLTAFTITAAGSLTERRGTTSRGSAPGTDVVRVEVCRAHLSRHLVHHLER
jgi:hypothetical protein